MGPVRLFSLHFIIGAVVAVLVLCHGPRIKKMPKIDTLDALEEHEEHEDDYQTNSN